MATHVATIDQVRAVPFNQSQTCSAACKPRYRPFRTEGKVEIRAISHDPALGKSGPAALETFDISKRDWTLVCISEKKSAASAD